MLKECLPEENVIRAILSAHWDQKKNRISSDLFKGINISVSRLFILPLNDLFKIFHKELDRPDFQPPKFVLGAGEIKIGHLQYVGINHTEPTKISVIPTPTVINPAHAEIPEKITKGLSRKIIQALIIHKESSRVSHLKDFFSDLARLGRCLIRGLVWGRGKLFK